jgi:hypothetical protein
MGTILYFQKPYYFNSMKNHFNTISIFFNFTSTPTYAKLRFISTLLPYFSNSFSILDWPTPTKLCINSTHYGF